MNAGSSPLPRYRPMLASPAPVHESWTEATAEWAEIKWDGYRCLAYVTDQETRLISRGGKDLTPLFPELSALHGWLSAPACVLDGEIIVMAGGRPSFSHLQQRSGIGVRSVRARQPIAPVPQPPAVFVAFDLLHLGGQSLIRQPLQQRRQQLEALMRSEDAAAGPGGPLPRPDDAAGRTGEPATSPEKRVQLSQIYQAPVQRLLEQTGQLGLEGIVVKDPSSPYVPGRRTRYWLKFKQRRTLLAVIVGFTRHGNGPGDGIKALLVASRHPSHREPGAGHGLQFLGRVGTGFSQWQRRHLLDRLWPLRRSQAPLDEVPNDVPEGVTWVEPVVQCRISYLEITPAGRLRQPSFLALEE